MNYILAFDVSNNSCSVAVSNGQKILALVEELRPHMQAEQLLPLIKSALQQAGIGFNQLNFLVVTNGPGSFTGIRIGLATAKGISLASNIQSMAISNFEFWHMRAVEQVKNYSKIIVLINAYRNQLYYQEFDQEDNPSEPQLFDIEKVIDILSNSPKNTVIIGTGVEIIYQDVRSFDNLQILPRFTRVRAIQLCRLADKKIKRGGSITKVEPLYIRPPDAKKPNSLL